MPRGISRGGCRVGLIACVLMPFGMVRASTHWGDIGITAAMLMLACLAAHRLRGLGLRSAWALPALRLPVFLS